MPRVDGKVVSALFVLIGFTSMFRDLQISSLHVANLLTFLGFAATFARGSTLRTATRDVLLLIFAVAALCLSMVGSVYYVNGLLWVQLCIQALSAVLVAAMVDWRRLKLISAGVIAGATVSSATAILQEFRILPSELFIDSSGLIRPTGLVGEPDWVGLYAAFALVVLLRWQTARTKLRGWLIVINALALLFSFARAAWLALVVSLIIALVMTRARGRPQYFDLRLGWKPVVATLAVGSLAALIFPDVANTAWTRVLSIFFLEHRDDNAQYRGQQLDGLIALAQSAPWNGYGLSASARVTIIGQIETAASVTTQNSVATNWVLALAADAKVLAVPFILLIGLLSVFRANTLGGQLTLVVAINSLFSNVMYNPVWWLAVAILVAAEKTGGLGERTSKVRRARQKK
ncbi:O-antigen ligase family protein [Microbacterium ureisolvens]|uniref:O-antigen ligase family protein n=1 Tax=Microbacterium ureisolvens TaxID=2781186 RepID=A0ABS7I244_9MICO|nr:O-antigen ligase family protein [Microbacterium ureisolvens]MBW9111731.1 O-antigen ligase family protein [Microbacterium ureisolvens]